MVAVTNAPSKVSFKVTLPTVEITFDDERVTDASLTASIPGVIHKYVSSICP